MKAVQYREIGKGPEVVEIDIPEPGPGPIRLKVTAAGLCHSDWFVMDLPAAALCAATQPMRSHINIGCGEDIAIGDLARLVATVTGFSGRIRFDEAKPDGAPRKLLDVSLLAALGWRASIGLEEGIRGSYDWFLTHAGALREA